MPVFGKNDAKNKKLEQAARFRIGRLALDIERVNLVETAPAATPSCFGERSAGEMHSPCAAAAPAVPAAPFNFKLPLEPMLHYCYVS
jgi:hypothetical protein